MNIKGKLDKTISNTVYGQAISILQMQGKFTVLFPWGKWLFVHKKTFKPPINRYTLQ